MTVYWLIVLNLMFMNVHDSPSCLQMAVSCIYICIYIIYTPNLEFNVAVSGRERERRFRGSREGARGSTEGAPSTPFHGSARVDP